MHWLIISCFLMGVCLSDPDLHVCVFASARVRIVQYYFHVTLCEDCMTAGEITLVCQLAV